MSKNNKKYSMSVQEIPEWPNKWSKKDIKKLFVSIKATFVLKQWLKNIKKNKNLNMHTWTQKL
jgi:hypothetical protein